MSDEFYTLMDGMAGHESCFKTAVIEVTDIAHFSLAWFRSCDVAPSAEGVAALTRLVMERQAALLAAKPAPDPQPLSPDVASLVTALKVAKASLEIGYASEAARDIIAAALRPYPHS